MARILIITNVSFFLLLQISLLVHITGGVRLLHAQVVKERYPYEVLLENNRSKILTRMKVYATSADDAKNQTYLNGWTVLDIKELPTNNESRYNSKNKGLLTLDNESFRFEATPPINSNLSGITSPYNSNSPQNSAGNSSGNNKPDSIATNPSLNQNKNNGNDNRTMLSDIGETGGVVDKSGDRKGADNSSDIIFPNGDILPNDPRIKLISIIYFDLGNIEDNGKVNGTKFENLNKDKRFIIFGNSDEVEVRPNVVYKNNFELSYKRALYIRDAMIALGIPAEKISAYGLGTRFLAVDTRENSALNRRVEIYEFR